MVYGESAVLSSRLEKTYKVVSSEHIYFRPYVRPASVSIRDYQWGSGKMYCNHLSLCVCIYACVFVGGSLRV